MAATDDPDLETVEVDLDAVEATLARLDEGIYGNCEVCGEAVGDDRLADDPTARTCADHSP